MTADENYRLIQEIDANRCFLLMAYRSNPHLIERADARTRALLGLPVADKFPEPPTDLGDHRPS